MHTNLIKHDNDIIVTIETNYEGLRKSEKKVADYILSNTDKIVQLTIGELSKAVKVSEPTVIRFCKSLGLSGYQDLKLQLASRQPEPLTIIHDDVSPLDDIKTVSEKVITSHIIALNQTLNQLDYEVLQSVSELLIESRNIDFYGLGGSGTVATDVENKFLRTGLVTHAIVDSHVQLMRVALFDHRDTLIIFSNTGNTKHFVRLLDIANQNGVKSIVVSTVANSPVGKLGTYNINVKAKEIRYKKEPSSSRIAMMAVMDIIVTHIALMKSDEYINNILLTREALKNEKNKR